jgi:hypothetical protein
MTDFFRYSYFTADGHDAGIMYHLTLAKKNSSPYAPTTGAKETMHRIKTYIKDGRDQLSHITY